MAKWTPNKQDLIDIEQWVADGMTEGSIHRKFGMSQGTWYSRKKDHPEIQEAIQAGKVRDQEVCMNRLRAIAFDDDKKGNLTALIFYGKINHGWNDGSRNDTSSKVTKVKLKKIKKADGNNS